jgi:endonuclease-3
MRYQILCSLQLSSQTQDQVNADAMKKLRTHFGDEGFNCDAILNVAPNVLDGLICKVGFHNKKTIYMQQTAAVLKEKYDGDIPDTIEGMLELPGIGIVHSCLFARTKDGLLGSAGRLWKDSRDRSGCPRAQDLKQVC